MNDTLCTQVSLQEVIDLHGGKLSRGKNSSNSGSCCILEAHSVCIGIDWTDDPVANRTFDIRPLNDMKVSSKLRTEWMPPVMAAYEGSLDWPHEKQVAVVTRILIGTVREIIAELPRLPTRHVAECRAVRTLKEAALAAKATELAMMTTLVFDWTTHSAGWAVKAAEWAAVALEHVKTAECEEEAATAAAVAASTAAAAAENALGRAAVFTTTCKLWCNAAEQC